jgi:hypothetical protein
VCGGGVGKHPFTFGAAGHSFHLVTNGHAGFLKRAGNRLAVRDDGHPDAMVT